MIHIALIEDIPEYYDLLKSLDPADLRGWVVSTDLSKTILDRDTLDDRKARGYVDGVHDWHDYASFESTHNLIGSEKCPKKLVLIVDLNLLQDPILIQDYQLAHRLQHIEDRLVAGTAIALQAIENEDIDSLLIYVSTTWGQTSDCIRRLKLAIDSTGLKRRVLYQGGLNKKFESLDKAREIITTLHEEWKFHFDRWTTAQFLSENFGLPSGEKHWSEENYVDGRPKHLPFLDGYLGYTRSETDRILALKSPDNTYNGTHIIAECLKDFGCRDTPSKMSCASLLLVALAAVRATKKDSDNEEVILSMIANLSQAYEADKETWKKFVRSQGILAVNPDGTSQERFRSAVEALYQMVKMLFFHNQEATLKSNLRQIDFDPSKLVFVLEFDGSRLVHNLHDAMHRFARTGVLPMEHDSTSAILKFWKLMQACCETDDILGVSWRPSARLEVKAERGKTLLIFHI